MSRTHIIATIIRLFILVLGGALFFYNADRVPDELKKVISGISTSDSDDHYLKAIAGIIISIGVFGFKYILFDKTEEFVSYVTFKDEESKTKLQKYIDRPKLSFVRAKSDTNILSAIKYLFHLSNTTLEYLLATRLFKTLAYLLLCLVIPLSVMIISWTQLPASEGKLSNIYIGIDGSGHMSSALPIYSAFLLFDNNKDDLFGNNKYEEIDKLQLSNLRNTLLSFISCLEQESDSIDIEVIGFASDPPAQGKMSNLELANKRGSNIHNRINELLKNDPLLMPYKDRYNIRNKTWESEKEMKSKRILREAGKAYSDILERDSSSIERINRRATLNVIKAGSCLSQ